jgi:hypothetical protein
VSVYVLFVYFLFVEFCYTRINKHSPLNQQPFVITSRSDRERERITVCNHWVLVVLVFW